MKVAFDHAIFAMQRHGGISRQMVELAQRLAGQHEVTVWAPLFVSEHLRHAPLRTVGIAVPQTPRTTSARLAANDVLLTLAAPFAKPDVVYETYYRRGPSFAAARGRVVVIHDMIPELLGVPGGEALAWSKARAVARADVVVCVSESTRRDLLALRGVEPDKVRVVPPACALAPAGPEVAAVHDRPFMLFIGLRDGYKNFDALLRAFAASSRLRDGLDLLCFGGPPLSAAEIARIEALGLSGKVRRRGGDDEFLAAHYRDARFVACPSLYEGFGLPVLEGLQLNGHVCASATSSLPEVGQDAAIYFDPHDEGSMTAVLERLLEDDTLRQTLRVKAKARAAEFSWDAAARSHLAIIAGLSQ